MSGEFLNVYKTFAKALDDLALGVDVIPENDDFDPPSAGRWIEMTMLSQDIDSMGKSGAGDEASGVLQLSLFDADTGTLSGNLLTLADLLTTSFKHGATFTEFGGVEVFIQRSTRNAGRLNGAFYQIDLSIYWTAYIDR
jgi:hypothetical protein